MLLHELALASACFFSRACAQSDERQLETFVERACELDRQDWPAKYIERLPTLTLSKHTHVHLPWRFLRLLHTCAAHMRGRKDVLHVELGMDLGDLTYSSSGW